MKDILKVKTILWTPFTCSTILSYGTYDISIISMLPETRYITPDSLRNSSGVHLQNVIPSISKSSFPSGYICTCWQILTFYFFCVFFSQSSEDGENEDPAQESLVKELQKTLAEIEVVIDTLLCCDLPCSL